MEAQRCARRKRVRGRWRHALESRRVLAPLLIAPAVIFMVLVVGVPFVWAIYLSLTDAIGGSLSGELGRLRQLHERVGGRELPPRAPQHARSSRSPRRRSSSSAPPSSRTSSSATSAASGSCASSSSCRGRLRSSSRRSRGCGSSTPSTASSTGRSPRLHHRQRARLAARTPCTSRRTRRRRCSGSAARTSRSSRSRSCTRGGSSRSRS